MGMYGDPDELDRLASGLRARATVVRDEADRHQRQAQAAHWVSAAAQGYRDRVGRSTGHGRDAADALDHAADVLVAHAQQVRETIAEIARAEQAVVGWLEDRWNSFARAADSAVRTLGQPFTVLHPWAGLPFDPTRLPAAGEAGWLDIHRMLPGIPGLP